MKAKGLLMYGELCVGSYDYLWFYGACVILKMGCYNVVIANNWWSLDGGVLFLLRKSLKNS